MKKVFTSLWHF